MTDLRQCTAIVTGGATGIGEAVSKRLALCGAHVLVNGLPEDPVDQVVLEIRQAGGVAERFIGDVSDPQVAQEMAKQALANFGCLNLCVANAARLYFGGRLGEFENDLFDAIVRNNLYGCYYTLRYALPELANSKGVLVTIGGVDGTDGLPFAGPYAACDAAIHALAMTAAREYAYAPVRVVNIVPGMIDTEMSHSNVGPMPHPVEESMLSTTLLGRRGTPEEVANVVAFVAGAEASFFTGTDIVIDGGFSISHDALLKTHHIPPQARLTLRHQFEGYHPPKAA